jgi:hypothetical protein
MFVGSSACLDRLLQNHGKPGGYTAQVVHITVSGSVANVLRGMFERPTAPLIPRCSLMSKAGPMPCRSCAGRQQQNQRSLSRYVVVFACHIPPSHKILCPFLYCRGAEPRKRPARSGQHSRPSRQRCARVSH